MKKLLVPSVSSIWKRVQNGNRDSRVLFFSTEAKSLVSLFPSPSQIGDNLYHRIMGEEKHKHSIAPIIDEWVKEGRPVELQILRHIIKRLRKHRFPKYALQIFEWIDESKSLQLSPGDIAIRLDLIGKTYGLDVAEKYFHNIPMNLRTDKVYGALLNCYVHFKKVDKAEDTLQKMRDEFGYDQCVSFTLLMNLYSKLGKFDKLHLLAQQVEEMGVIVDKYFQYTRLNAYATARDVTGMEGLVKKMEVDRWIVIDSCYYTILANGYIRAGDFKKALEAVKNFEGATARRRDEIDYNFLLSLYASLGRRADVYRIWEEYKGVGKLQTSSGYLAMISALEKLGEHDAMEKIAEEWESHNSMTFDIRIPNFLINSHCRRGSLGKAEAVVEKVVERMGAKVGGGTWGRMGRGYAENKEMDKAVEALWKSVLATRPGGKLNMRLLATCVKYLESKGKFERADDIVKSIKRQGLARERFDEILEEYIRKL